MVSIGAVILGFIALMGLFTLAPTDPHSKLIQHGDNRVEIVEEPTTSK